MLVTIEQLRIAAGLDPTDTTQDADITVLYELALAVIENYCDRKFELQADTEIFTHFAGYTIGLRRFPITIDPVVLLDEGPDITPHFHTERETGTVHFDGRYKSHEITISYTGGYDETTAPADLQWVLLRVFKLFWADYNGQGLVEAGSVKQVKIGDLMVSFNTTGITSGDGDAVISPVMANLLANYKRWSV